MDDPIVNPEAALNFYRSLKISDKELKTYPGFLHESFNEIGKERVFEDLEKWINQHSLGN
jgi:alpha-beta hydrolase superfamily lysophospholipase